jgi:hypothetical protein
MAMHTLQCDMTNDRDRAVLQIVDLVNRLESEAHAGRQGRLADYLGRLDFVVLVRREVDDRAARSADPSLRNRRDGQGALALQKPRPPRLAPVGKQAPPALSCV